MNIEKHRAFIDSLECEKGLPDEMHGWRFGTQLNKLSHAQPGDAWRFRDYMIERCRRAESRQIPDLKDRVKELVRDAMDLTHDLIASRLATDATHEFYKAKYDAFRSLCAPDKGGEVKP